jgi:hypothetical protein
MTRSSSSSSLKYINPKLLDRGPLYEQPQAKYVYYETKVLPHAQSAGPAATARYGVVSRGVPPLTPPTPPPRTTRKALGTKKALGTTRTTRTTRRASGTKKAPTIISATSV